MTVLALIECPNCGKQHVTFAGVWICRPMPHLRMVGRKGYYNVAVFGDLQHRMFSLLLARMDKLVTHEEMIEQLWHDPWLAPKVPKANIHKLTWAVGRKISALHLKIVPKHRQGLVLEDAQPILRVADGEAPQFMRVPAL